MYEINERVGLMIGDKYITGEVAKWRKKLFRRREYLVIYKSSTLGNKGDVLCTQMKGVWRTEDNLIRIANVESEEKPLTNDSSSSK